MEPYVPKSTAWRKKVGIHSGGLQGGLDATFGGHNRKIEAYCDIFEAITARLLIDPFASIEDLGPHPAQTNVAHKKGTSVKNAVTSSGAGIILNAADTTGDLTKLVNTI